MELLLLILCGYFIPSYAQNPDRLYKLELQTEDQVKKLINQEDAGVVDLLSRPVLGGSALVRVVGASSSKFETFLQESKVGNSVEMEGLSAAKTNERKQPLPLGQMSWDAYYTVDGIYAWIDNVATKYSNMVTVKEIGRTHEKNPIRAVTITHPNWNKKHSTLVDCLIHAREMIAGAQCTYIINELTARMDEYLPLLEDVRFFIIPVLNPDGYKHVETDQWWRKNRRPVPPYEGTECIGVDLNRNFPFHWGGVGSGSISCAGNYRGESACSELECQHLTAFIKANKPDTYFTLHCFSQLLLSPWSYANVTPPDQPEIEKLTNAICHAMVEFQNTSYTCGISGHIFPSIGGVSDDWAKSEGVKFVYTIELPPLGNPPWPWINETKNPFHLPERLILPTCKETWNGIRVGAWRRHINGTAVFGEDSGSSHIDGGITGPFELAVTLTLMLKWAVGKILNHSLNFA